MVTQRFSLKKAIIKCAQMKQYSHDVCNSSVSFDSSYVLTQLSTMPTCLLCLLQLRLMNITPCQRSTGDLNFAFHIALNKGYFFQSKLIDILVIGPLQFIQTHLGLVITFYNMSRSPSKYALFSFIESSIRSSKTWREAVLISVHAAKDSIVSLS